MRPAPRPLYQDKVSEGTPSAPAENATLVHKRNPSSAADVNSLQLSIPTVSICHFIFDLGHDEHSTKSVWLCLREAFPYNLLPRTLKKCQIPWSFHRKGAIFNIAGTMDECRAPSGCEVYGEVPEIIPNISHSLGYNFHDNFPDSTHKSANK